MNKEYWEEYWRTHEVLAPSSFAKWARPRMEGIYVFDVGCGNGRDTTYLAEQHRTIGIDPFAPNSLLYRQLTWQQMLEEYPDSEWNTLYARFFLHSIEEHEEAELLEAWQGQVFIEARELGDDIDDTHWRRPISSELLVDEMISMGYQIKYYEISDEFSIQGDDKPLLFRIEAKRWT